MDDFKDDELIEIKLPRKDYEILRTIIKREEAYSWFTAAIKNHWVWVAGGGIVILWNLYERFHTLFVTVK